MASCPAGDTQRGGGCYLEMDAADCGACQTACPTGMTCEKGTCG